MHVSTIILLMKSTIMWLEWPEMKHIDYEICGATETNDVQDLDEMKMNIPINGSPSIPLPPSTPSLQSMLAQLFYQHQHAHQMI